MFGGPRERQAFESWPDDIRRPKGLSSQDVEKPEGGRLPLCAARLEYSTAIIIKRCLDKYKTDDS